MLDNDCLFCGISKSLDKAYLISENENAFSILDLNPIEKGHFLIITKKHFDNLLFCDQENWNSLLSLLKTGCQIIREKFKVENFNVISNVGKLASQEIKHLHIHVIPKYEKERGFNWNILKNSSKDDLASIFQKIKNK